MATQEKEPEFCGSCFLFDQFSDTAPEGKCRRNPPMTVFGSHHEDGMTSHWPQVDGSQDWCGEYRSKPA